MIYSVVFFSLLAALAFLFVFAPVLAGTKRQRRQEGGVRLEAEKQTLVQLLRDIEFDFRMGKLSPADYQSTRDEAESRALSVLQSMDTARPELTPAALEAEITRLRDRMARGRRRG